MIKKILLAIVLVFLITGMGFAFQNEPDGFRGLKWGDPPTEDMTFLYQRREEDFYYKANDKMEIWGVKLGDITYSFYKKKEFIGVMGGIMSDDDYSILEIFCREKFGKPSKDYFSSITGDRNLVWCGEKSRISLSRFPVTDFFVRVLFFSKGEELKEEEKDTKQEGLEEKRPIILSGFGQEASEKFVLEEGLVRFNFVYKGQHNFSVWLLDNNGKEVELLVNTIGDFNGSKAIGIDKTGIYLLDISADDYWTIIIYRD